MLGEVGFNQHIANHNVYATDGSSLPLLNCDYFLVYIFFKYRDKRFYTSLESLPVFMYFPQRKRKSKTDFEDKRMTSFLSCLMLMT